MPMSADDKERLIRLEERVTALQQDVRDINDTLNELARSIHTNELLVNSNTLTLGKGERLFWIVMSGVVGLVIWLLKQGVA
jgi:uncharacterized coiled-coil protein SlyX